MSNCDKAKLKSAIQDYWDKKDLGTKHYIETILPREMACAQADDIERLPDKQCHQLVFLVGHSLEPLFQSIWAYKPKRVLLILSQDYGEKLGSGDILGEDIADDINDILVKIPEANLVPVEVACRIIEGEQKDTTQTVFRMLLDEIKEDISQVAVEEKTYPVVVDITGAKKSMVAGAFLFAAFTGVPVSYVDFDDDQYDRKSGKPYGYACRIGEVANPYQSFSLREWERVRTLYHQYNFRGAKEILEERIEPAMREYLPDHLDKVGRLKQILDCYEQWDNGDFSGAWETTQEITKQLQDFTPPTAVEGLGKDGYWPQSDNAKSLLKKLKRIEFGVMNDYSDSLYFSPKLLVLYADDELARIERLLGKNEDYRSALLRSVGLWEILMRARIIGLWSSDNVNVSVNSEEDADFQDLANAPEIVKHWSTQILENLLLISDSSIIAPCLRPKRSPLRIILDSKRINDLTESLTIYIRPKDTVPPIEKSVLIGNLRDLRNKAIHTYLSVPENISREAFNVVNKNLTDYKETWLSVIFESVEIPATITRTYPWSQLCELCKLSDFLTPNLRRDSQRKEPSQ